MLFKEITVEEFAEIRAREASKDAYEEGVAKGEKSGFSKGEKSGAAKDKYILFSAQKMLSSTPAVINYLTLVLGAKAMSHLRNRVTATLPHRQSLNPFS